MSPLIDLLHELPILGRILLMLLVMLLVAIIAQLTHGIFSSMRSWKFTAGVMTLGFLCVWLCMHLYAVAYVGLQSQKQCEAPKPVTATTKPATPSKTPTSTLTPTR